MMNKRNYEIPISPTYVHNWGIKEAVRELLQNAIDGDKCGYPKEITYDEAARELHIKNEGVTLDVSTLVLGASGKQNNDELIGHYGEGYKLALVVLLRNGREVTINNGAKTWTPSFKMSKKFNTKVLNISEVDNDGGEEYIEFVLGGVSEEEYQAFLLDFPGIDSNYGDVVESENGYILLDKRFSGKMFIEGLFIQRDENFKYGYNFNSSCVNLDRDRKAINYYELRKLTAAAVVTAEHCSPEIFKAISDSCTDVKDIKEVLDEASTEFLQEYRDMLYDTKGLEQNTLVATDSVAKQLRQMNISTPIAKGSEIESYLVAKANDKLGLIYEAKNNAEKRSKEDDDWDDAIYSDFRLIMEWYCKYKSYLPYEAIQDFDNNIIPEIKPSYIKTIEKYLSDDCMWTQDELEEAHHTTE